MRTKRYREEASPSRRERRGAGALAYNRGDPMRIGVLLAGCGLYDGSDVHETVFLLEALEAAGERPVLMAPDLPLARTVDHLTGDAVDGEERRVWRESARLARGRVRSLAEVDPGELLALIIPGGYGPALNFATGFATPDIERRLHPEVRAFLMHFVEAGKPIGLIGLGELPVALALGEPATAPETPVDPAAIAVDPRRPILRTPGFAAFTRLVDVRRGVESLVREILDRLDAPAVTRGAQG
jgi:enhancing lycopene biosynthesis protein 2